jgi:hypothetical protein
VSHWSVDRGYRALRERIQRVRTDPRHGELEGNERLLCSLCGKSRREVKKLIVGPGVYICEACVALSVQILDEGLDEGLGPDCLREARQTGRD